MSSIEVVVAKGAVLGEGPVWSPDDQVLWWVDIEGRAVHRYDPSSGTDERRDLAMRPGSLARTADPDVLLVAAEHTVMWLEWSTGAITPWLELEEPGVGIRMNDGRTDPAGRFIVGSMFENTRAGKSVGSLHRIEADGTIGVLRTGVGVSNGLGFDEQAGHMFWTDTATQQVRRFDYDLATGQVSNESLFLDYAELDGKPDGACVDADGCYWSASVHGWAVIRVTPQGVIDRRIELPVAKPTMPAFGGPALDTLFVTSIGDHGEAESRDGVEPGALLAIDLSSSGITGRVDTPFAGLPPSA